MDISVYSIKNVTDEQVAEMISAKKSFVLEDIGRTNMGEAIDKLERMLKNKGLKSRVYTKGRSAAIIGELAVPLVGWASVAAIGIHNLATWNTDYEIAKNIVTGTLTVNYKK